MKTTALIVTAAAFIACTTLKAQNVVFQQAGVISADGNITIAGGPVMAAAGGRAVTGNPFSATEQTHSLQVLGDGSRIEQSNSTQLSRDSEGRTRREPVSTTSEKPAIVTIEDPVAGANYLLDPLHKTANKLPLPKTRIILPATGATSATTSPSKTIHIAGPGEGPQVASFQPGIVNLDSAVAPAQEDLGTQNVSGVLAKGTRSTITIPTGQIGNDRPLQVVSERWYSDEIGMLVKTTNSDPRFGTTTYELTNISRAAPDPSLFLIPSDYSVNEGKAMFRTGGPK